MIIGKIHQGSGLGDQLFSYIITRVIALDKGYEFGFVGKEYFKGASFMNLDWGKETERVYWVDKNTGELILDIGEGTYKGEKNYFKFDKSYYDPEVNFIQDGTIIDGYGAQDERYWGHRLGEIKEWLKTRPCDWGDDSFTQPIVLNFRGGEYKAIPELFLPLEYWQKTIMWLGDDMHESPIIVHTDDPVSASEWFKHYSMVQDIEKNWNALRYAKCAIISNSAFAIIPRLLAHQDQQNAITVAPKYWAGRNVGEWRRPQNFYKAFQYI